MAIPASTVIHLAVDQLLDVTSIRWPADELVRYLNAGQREIVTHRPDVMTTAAAPTLAAGTKQTLPAAGMKLVNIFRNTVTKKAVTKVERDYLDQSIPGWHAITGAAEILHFMYDPMDPRVYWVYPPANGSTAQLDISYTAMTTDVAEPSAGSIWSNVSGNIGVPDIYANALVDYVVFRALSKNSKFVGNDNRAMAYLANFANSLGVELKTLLAASMAMSTNLNPNERGAVGASSMTG